MKIASTKVLLGMALRLCPLAVIRRTLSSPVGSTPEDFMALPMDAVDSDTSSKHFSSIDDLMVDRRRPGSSQQYLPESKQVLERFQPTKIRNMDELRSMEKDGQQIMNGILKLMSRDIADHQPQNNIFPREKVNRQIRFATIGKKMERVYKMLTRPRIYELYGGSLLSVTRPPTATPSRLSAHSSGLVTKSTPRDLIEAPSQPPSFLSKKNTAGDLEEGESERAQNSVIKKQEPSTESAKIMGRLNGHKRYRDRSIKTETSREDEIELPIELVSLINGMTGNTLPLIKIWKDLEQELKRYATKLNQPGIILSDQVLILEWIKTMFLLRNYMLKYKLIPSSANSIKLFEPKNLYPIVQLYYKSKITQPKTGWWIDLSDDSMIGWEVFAEITKKLQLFRESMEEIGIRQDSKLASYLCLKNVIYFSDIHYLFEPTEEFTNIYKTFSDAKFLENIDNFSRSSTESEDYQYGKNVHLGMVSNQEIPSMIHSLVMMFQDPQKRGKYELSMVHHILSFLNTYHKNAMYGSIIGKMNYDMVLKQIKFMDFFSHHFAKYPDKSRIHRAATNNLDHIFLGNLSQDQEIDQKWIDEATYICNH
ncbi:hypothetical protein KEM48_012502 [Puccinia striiformis f. sp. tritici PST-130]|nr:hypothetical protein Pst134EB_025254 [Puccinia striiformis f. sp. tritici]KAI9629868.1 hypothetical protein KEM48_012502 [Puccinia striiformis f. sp. tritici PST-130]